MNYEYIGLFIDRRQLKAKCDALEKHLFDCESEKNTNKKQLADAMVFLRETINEQEALLRRAAGDGRNDASAAVLSATISARVKALTEHLKVYSPKLFYNRRVDIFSEAIYLQTGSSYVRYIAYVIKYYSGWYASLRQKYR